MMIRASRVVAVVALLGLATFVAANGAATPSLERPFSVASTVKACDGHCDPCEPVQGGDGHDFHEQSEYEREGQDHSCFGLDCDDWHEGVCGLPVPDATERELLSSRLRGIANGDPDGPAALLRDYEGFIHINQSRRVLQVSGTCSPDLIVAQVGLSPAQLAALSDIP